MDILKESQTELEMGTTPQLFQKFIKLQGDLFHDQVDHLQNILVKQCKLTGVNPLSQEMAAGALSVKIGKRPRDLLNPKAVKYMQSVFAIKDAISKKESREISVLFGVTVTQVRDFFTSQRSRVRKFVRLSREKAFSSLPCVVPQFEPPLNVEPPLSTEESLSREDPLNSEAPLHSESQLNTGLAMIASPIPLNSIGPWRMDEAPSCSTHNEAPPGIDDSEKHFVNNIFNLMQREETFSGQVKLMEWILTLKNPSVLSWFLSKGGVMVLATWLSFAASEEQTSVLHIILKVLCHLPLHKAFPAHMSTILHSVNGLRFYRSQGVSNRSRVLLSRWSNLFLKTQALRKKTMAIQSSSDMHNELLLKQSIGEIMDDEFWQSKAHLSENSDALKLDFSEKNRKLKSPPLLRLLPASSDDSNKKHVRDVSTNQSKERRKVQLVEQPGQKTSTRNLPSVRVVHVGRGRPISADDIQKAKMRAIYMQKKHGKIPSTSEVNRQMKTERSSSQNNIMLSASVNELQPKNREDAESPIDHSKISDHLDEGVLNQKAELDLRGLSQDEIFKRLMIPWHVPQEMKINDEWRVGAAENSKEVEVQNNRITREKEAIYPNPQHIPLNPKEPWDLEIDYDDTLTPEIPSQQLPDEHEPPPVPEPGPEPDFELLAVLLRNPGLVFSLTGGAALSNEETVRLLDMIKNGAGSLPGIANECGVRVEERVEVCLPSPTPSTDPITRGWRSEMGQHEVFQKSGMEMKLEDEPHILRNSFPQSHTNNFQPRYNNHGHDNNFHRNHSFENPALHFRQSDCGMRREDFETWSPPRENCMRWDRRNDWMQQGKNSQHRRFQKH